MARTDMEKKRFAAIGLMSGTSMDGIDVALVVTNGKSKLERGPGASYGYEPAFRQRLADALEIAKKMQGRDERPGGLSELEQEITRRHAAAVMRFLEENRLRLPDVDVIGFHGQTVLHRPDRGFTVQLGDGDLLSRETGLAVVWDLRANDMVHGGQGAPLVPVYHRALARNLPAPLAGKWPVAFINIGGIANLTWVSETGGLVAFDTGPGNALIDQWVSAHAGIPYDANGAIASEGLVLPDLAARYLSSPFFDRNYPKSLDRNDFPVPEAEAASLEDGARTLAHVTAASIARAFDLLPEMPRLAILCGGGRKNPAIVAETREELSAKGAEVLLAEEAGFDGDATEAEAWGYLAVRSIRALKITWPDTTGVRVPSSGGRISYPPPARP